MYPSYYEFSYALENAGLALVPVLLTRGVPTAMFQIAAYVLTALALYTLAKRRCIDHPWLAWVPVANLWLLGSLSDQYRYVVRGQVRSRRKMLLVLKTISLCLGICVAVLAVVAAVKGISGAGYGMRGDRILESVMGTLLAAGALSLPMLGVNVALAVFRYMALYDVYTSCDPDNNVLFTALSVLFRFTEPFFLFFSRMKDQGMPPRREAATPPPQWEEPQPEPWENKDYL